MSESLKINVIAKTLGIKSLVDLYAGFKMLQGGISTVKNAVTKLTTAYKDEEKANIKVLSALQATGGAAGLTAQELNAMAVSLKELTGESTSAIQEAQGVMLTFTKIGKETFPDAIKSAQDMSAMFGQDLQQSVIQLGTALNDPIAGVGRLKRIGISFSEDQKKMIENHMAHNDILSAQKVIINELNAEFGGIAANMRGTYAGAVKALKSEQEELYAAGGKIIAMLGKDMVEAMTNATRALNDFARDAETLEIISIIFDSIKDAIEPIKELFENFTDSSNKLKGEMSGLEVVLKLVASAIIIISKFGQAVYNIWVDWIKIIENVARAVKNLWDLLFGNKEQKEAAKKSFAEIGESFKKMGEDFVQIGTDTVSDLKKVWDGVSDAVSESQATALGNYQKGNKDIIDEQKKTGDEIIKTEREIWEEAMQERDAALREGYQRETEAQKEQNEKNIEIAMEYGNQMLEITEEILGVIQEAFDQYYENQIEQVQEAKDEQLMEIDDWMQKEMERQGVKEASKKEKLEKELEDLKLQLQKETDVENQDKLKKQIKEKEDALKRQKIQDEADKKKEKAMKDAAKKEEKIKREQFEMNKAFQIAMVWVNAATAIMGFWAAFASMGIPGIILAAIATAAVLALAGVQTGLIASQSFAEGGIVGGSMMTGDQVPANVNSGELILNRAQQDNIAGQLGGGVTYIIEHMEVVANNPEELAIKLDDLNRQEANR